MCLKVNILGRIPKQWQGSLGEHRELELGLPYPEAVDFLGHFTQLLRWLPTERNSGALGNSLMVDPCLSHTAHSVPSPLLRFLSQKVTLHPNPWGYAGLGRTQTKQKKLAFRNDSIPTMIKWKHPFSMVAWMRHVVRWEADRLWREYSLFRKILFNKSFVLKLYSLSY